MTTRTAYRPTVRRCACGGVVGPSGECAACGAKRLQRAVEDVVRSPGRPLEPGVRGEMEARFGHDFSRVRVHTDERAAESARALGAQAYTVGSDITFGAGGHPSSTAAGRRLLAHELAHVVQQGGRASTQVMPSAVSGYDDPLEDDADRAARAVESGERVEVVRKTGDTGTIYRAPLGPLVDLLPPIQAFGNLIKALAASCEHSAALTWADFTAAPPARSGFQAETHFHFDPTTAGGHDVVQAVFEPTTSWVKPRWPNAANRAQNGCASEVSRCQAHFDRSARQGLVGVTFGPLGPPVGCAASIVADQTKIATTRDECDTVYGAECDRVAQLESARLLRHEQGHYDLACALARKGTIQILLGQPPAAMLAAVRRASGTQTAAYDNDSQNGCVAAQQAAWETRISDGLPAVTLTAPPPPPGRGGRRP